MDKNYPLDTYNKLSARIIITVIKNSYLTIHVNTLEILCSDN